MNRNTVIVLALDAVVGAGIFFVRKKPATSSDAPASVLDPLGFGKPLPPDPDNPPSTADTGASVGPSSFVTPDDTLSDRGFDTLRSSIR